MKKQKIKGYTNNPEAVTKGDVYNTTSIDICPAIRYRNCVKTGICGRLEPISLWDKASFVGKEHSRNITKADEAKITRKLKAAVKRCKPVTVVLTVDVEP